MLEAVAPACASFGGACQELPCYSALSQCLFGSTSPGDDANVSAAKERKPKRPKRGSAEDPLGRPNAQIFLPVRSTTAVLFMFACLVTFVQGLETGQTMGWVESTTMRDGLAGALTIRCASLRHT